MILTETLGMRGTREINQLCKSTVFTFLKLGLDCLKGDRQNPNLQLAHVYAIYANLMNDFWHSADLTA